MSELRHEILAGVARQSPALARQLDEGWDVPIGEWSRALWADPPEGARFEPPLREALVVELAGRTGDAGAASALVDQVERVGAVLTPHHVCPTNGPTFGAIDRIAALGAPGPILVLAWSGVPMSNTAASGSLCYSRAPIEALLAPGPELSRQRAAAKDRARDGVTEGRVGLLPPALRDALVYGCPMSDRTREVLAAASGTLRAVVPEPDAGEDYPAWALRTCEGIERRLVGRDDLWYCDLNRVAARYLAAVLADEGHPLSRLFGTPHDTGPMAALGGMSWLYARRPGKRESVETRVGTSGTPLGELRDGIASGVLCPGLVPVFGALRLLSRIRLLGGFRQVGYLEEIAGAWLGAGVVDADAGVPGRLVTGRLTGADGGPLYPLDVVVGAADRGALPGAADPMSVVWAPLVPRLEQG